MFGDLISWMFGGSNKLDVDMVHNKVPRACLFFTSQAEATQIPVKLPEIYKLRPTKY